MRTNRTKRPVEEEEEEEEDEEEEEEDPCAASDENSSGAKSFSTSPYLKRHMTDREKQRHGLETCIQNTHISSSFSL